jgi:hypothetical protein
VAFSVNTLTPIVENHIIHKTLNPDGIEDHWTKAYLTLIGTVFLICVVVNIVFHKIFIAIFAPVYNHAAIFCKHVCKNNILKSIKNICSTNIFIFCFCGLLGSVFFIHTFGVLILDWTYTDWLMAPGDLSQHYTGWAMFRNSAWYFPLGCMDNIVHPYRISVIYTDSIPWLAIFFKLLSPLLPTSFQYFGFYGLIVYFLQGALGGLIIKRLTRRTLYSIIGSLFFIFSTVVMQRIYGHTALSGHFIILLCIYVCITKTENRTNRRNTIIWSALFILATGIHLYFVPMVCIFMIFYLLEDFMQNRKIKSILIPFVFSIIILFMIMFAFGAFSSGSYGAGGLGNYSSNLNTLFNPAGGETVGGGTMDFASNGTSQFIKPLPLATGLQFQYEGYGYLGAGIIFALLLLLGHLLTHLSDFKNIKEKLRKDKVLYVILYIGIMFVFFIIAVSPIVTLNSHKLFGYYIPVYNSIMRIFRSTGRFIWPLMYIIICLVIIGLYRIYDKKISFVLLCLCMIIQFYDLSPWFANKGVRFKTSIPWQSELKSPEWNEIIRDKNHIVFLYDTPCLYSFLDIAINRRLTINDSYLARKDSSKIEAYKEQQKQLVLNGKAANDTLFIFTPQSDIERYVNNLRIISIDGIIAGVCASPGSQ